MSATTANRDLKKVDGEDEGEGEGDQGSEVEEPMHEFSWYLRPDQTFKIITTKWGVFTILAGIVYSYELTLTISGVNNYCDITRKNQCGMANDADQASAVFDLYIALPTIFHLIEWLRWCAFLTACLVNANLMKFFYILQWNIPFGIFAMIVSISGRFSTEGNACAVPGYQEERARYCILQLLCLLLSPFMCFAHIIFLKVKGVETIHAWYLQDGDEEED